MRDRPPEPQHIEVTTVDDPSWWDDSPIDDHVAEPPLLAGPPRRRRRIAVLSALTSVAVLAAVLMFSDDDKHTPAPLAAGHFIIDALGLRPYSADIVTPLPADASYTLFADGNPTNPWISLQVFRSDAGPVAALDSTRRRVGERNFVTPRSQPSKTALSLDLGDGWQAQVRAFNVEDDELLRFADSVQLTDGTNGGVSFDEDLLAASGLKTFRTAPWADDLLYGTVVTEMSAVTPEGAKITLHESIADVDRRPATMGYFTTGRVADADGYTADTLSANGDSIVAWATAGRLLSLTGPVSTSDLLAVSRTVRIADDSEWRQLLYGLHPDYRLGEFAELSASAPGVVEQWSSGFQLAASGGRAEYLWWWTLPGTQTSASTPTRTDLAAGPGNETIVVGDATYVFVWVPAKSDQIFASVRANDGSVMKLQLRLMFADVPVRLAATRIDVPGRIDISTE